MLKWTASDSLPPNAIRDYTCTSSCYRSWVSWLLRISYNITQLTGIRRGARSRTEQQIKLEQCEADHQRHPHESRRIYRQNRTRIWLWEMDAAEPWEEDEYHLDIRGRMTIWIHTCANYVTNPALSFHLESVNLAQKSRWRAEVDAD